MLKILLIIGALIILVAVFVVGYGHRYTKWASKQSIAGTWLFTGKDYSITYQFVQENDNSGLFYRLHEDNNCKFRVFGSWLLQEIDILNLLPLASELPERFTIGNEYPAKLHFIVNQKNQLTVFEGDQPFNLKKIEKDIRSEFEIPTKENLHNKTVQRIS